MSKPNYDVDNGGDEIPYQDWVRLRKADPVAQLRSRAAEQRERGWELMREGDPALLETAADEIELLRKVLGERARGEADANARNAALKHRISQLTN